MKHISKFVLVFNILVINSLGMDEWVPFGQDLETANLKLIPIIASDATEYAEFLSKKGVIDFAVDVVNYKDQGSVRIFKEWYLEHKHAEFKSLSGREIKDLSDKDFMVFFLTKKITVEYENNRAKGLPSTYKITLKSDAASKIIGIVKGFYVEEKRSEQKSVAPSYVGFSFLMGPELATKGYDMEAILGFFCEALSYFTKPFVVLSDNHPKNIHVTDVLSHLGFEPKPTNRRGKNKRQKTPHKEKQVYGYGSKCGSVEKFPYIRFELAQSQLHEITTNRDDLLNGWLEKLKVAESKSLKSNKGRKKKSGK